MRYRMMESKFIKRPAISAVAVFSLLLGVGSASAAASVQDNPQNQAGVPVHMVVTVKPHRGAQVSAVAGEDVRVFQGKSENKVTSWVPLQGDRAGLELFILIDDTSRDSLSLQFRTLEKFIEDQPPSTAIGIGYMRNGTVFTTQELTKDHALAAKALRLPIGASAGFTSPYLAISDLMKRWPVSQDRREILMITSGIDPLGGGFSNDPYTNPYLDAAVDRAERGGFIVYSIYSPAVGRASRGLFRTEFAQAGLDLLAQKTGGETYYLAFGSPVDITPYLDDVSFRLKHQYELTFLAKASKKPALEPVKLKTELPNTGLISAEEGYVGSGT
jgi:hypothetical protein